MKKKCSINNATTIKESHVCLTAKRNRNEEDTECTPRKKISLSTDSPTEKLLLTCEKFDHQDSNCLDSEYLLSPAAVNMNTQSFHISSEMGKMVESSKKDSLETSNEAINLTALSPEELSKYDIHSSKSLSYQENSPSTSSISTLDTNGTGASHSVLPSAKDDETSSFSSKLPFYDAPFGTSYESDLSISLSQSICDEGSKKKNFKKKKKRKVISEFSRDAKSLRPNYFVAVQISNPEIHQAIVSIQQRLLDSSEKFAPSLIDVATLHITLLVAHLATEEEVHKACAALDYCGAAFCEDLSEVPIFLKFKGLSHFRHQTLFAKCVEDEHYWRFLRVAERIRTLFSDRGVTMPDEKELVPHLTIAKLSKMPRKKGEPGIRKINPASYEEHVDREFGDQLVTGLQLLSMTKGKNINRYYYNEREVVLDVTPKESLDHSRCCHPRQPLLPRLARNDCRDLHTAAVASHSSSFLPSLDFLFPSGGRSPPRLHFSGRAVTAGLVGSVALVSLAFVVSRWMRRR